MHQPPVHEESIGFIGLGVMGQPMARNLLASGRRLTIFDRSSNLDELVAAGATRTASAREVAARADVVILMLPDSPDVEQVTVGDDGLLTGLRQDTLIIDMSTISPVVTRRLAEIVEARGAHWVDAPVSGGDKGAVAGTLSIMVGGRDEDVERARPLLDVMGSTVVHLGPVGAGQSVKAANQVVVGAVFQALAEALNLTDRAGIDRDKVITVLQGGLAHTRCLELRKENYLTRSFEPGFRIELHHKDLGIALDAGRAAGVPMPVTSLVREFMGSMVARGQGRMDHSGLYEFVAQNARGMGEGA
jgi:2-hydroxy-3-oxopropionate reductase